MIKSRPVLTKSVTSSLIYIAADLTSQVLFLYGLFCVFVDLVYQFELVKYLIWRKNNINWLLFFIGKIGVESSIVEVKPIRKRGLLNLVNWG